MAKGFGVPPIVELLNLQRASRKAACEKESFEEVKELLNAGSGSLGGTRPKASVVDGKRILLAKFSHPGDDWDVMAWERTAIDLAHKAQIDVPYARLVPVGAQRVLLLERFDRKDSLLEGRRIPYLSAMSLLGSNDGFQSDYVELAEALTPFVADCSTVLAQLYARIVFSISIHNTDDHMRNTGFVRNNKKWELAPLFDVNPNPYQNVGRATSILGETDNKEAEALAEAAPFFGLSRAEAQKIVKGILEATNEWQQVARLNSCKAEEVRLFESCINPCRKALKQAFCL